MICPECGSLYIEIYKHSATGASAGPELPDAIGEYTDAIGEYTYECQRCGHEFTEDELNELDRTLEYIQMCLKAKEIQDSHFFGVGDNFYAKNKGVHVVKEVKRDLLLTELDAYQIENCYWIPTKSQLRNEIKKFISDVDLLFDQFCNDKSRTWHYPNLKIYFDTEDKRLLALFMAERYKEFWIKTKKEWMKDPNF